ncbi:sulfhydryl oxidase 2 isoform X1 [Ziziphus jujuba]|uniref:Sulfhydryl oxidase n=1 Tax=Ziziphus jujuba TaxID=326968 RepID=A0A6P4AKD5_ZIZJJ|nr:sulfhydryl oxidase 2 isoform X1 [Ziziphus jujuba]XP_060669378.1 sulfhydryl oxidase 2 isoform X1 [Ziziphus jujuba]
MSRTLGLLILNLVLVSFGFSSPSLGSRSILRSFNDDSGDPHDYAIELNATNFDAVLRETPATYAVVEFFAHWCPACRNYKPHYEKVARLFNGADAVHPGMILMTRVDCASKINTKLCDKFSVGHYPMLFWGPPSEFVGGGWEPKREKSDIVLIDDGRTADRLLNWINKQMGSSFGLDDEKFENEHLSSNVSDTAQIARAVYDVEEATATAFDIILEHKMIKSETRGSLIKFLQLLVAHHPSRRCRKGSADVLVNFDELFPSDIWLEPKQEENDGKNELGSFHICGKDVPRGYWMFCRGSKNDTRGFSCGLWVLLHSLSVRVDDGESQFAFKSICDFVHNFFICEECRQHFYDMCSSVSHPFNKTSDFALWLWSAHNKVNERLMKEEASLGTGDPKFPKMIWPPKQLCPSCFRSRNPKNYEVDWDRDEVFKFLTGYYGKTLVSLYKDKTILGKNGIDAALEDLVVSTNAVVVPVGAALAIAVASCAFGALACYWRSQQKSRKYFHHLHSLKNI